MIPVIDDFVQRFSLTDFIVVADAALLSRKNIKLLKQAGYKFILGGRIKKESKPVQDWVPGLEKDPHKLNETIINGDERIIVSYSGQRAAKDLPNRDKGILRLLNIGLSVDKVLDIAKTISTVTIRLDDGTTHTRTLLNTDEEQLLAPLLPQ